MVVLAQLQKPIMVVLLNEVNSGILPNKVFLGFILITGELNLIKKPTNLPVFFSFTASFNVLL